MIVVGCAQPPPPPPQGPQLPIPPPPPSPPPQVLTDSWGGGCRIRTSCSRPPSRDRGPNRAGPNQGPIFFRAFDRSTIVSGAFGANEFGPKIFFGTFGASKNSVPIWGGGALDPPLFKGAPHSPPALFWGTVVGGRRRRVPRPTPPAAGPHGPEPGPPPPARPRFGRHIELCGPAPARTRQPEQPPQCPAPTWPDRQRQRAAEGTAAAMLRSAVPHAPL